MDIGDRFSGLRDRENVLAYQAYTQRLVGRLVCLFRFRKKFPVADDDQAEKLMNSDP